ncbi:MAG: metallophosphoesterase [bacterium]
MREFFPLVALVIAIGLVGGIGILMLFALNRPWWKRRWIRRTSWMLPLSGILMVGLWGLSVYNSWDWLATGAAVLAVVVFVAEMALMLSLPFSGLVHLADWLTGLFVRRHARKVPEAIDRKRRNFLRLAAAALPAATVGLGVVGVGRALTGARIVQVPLQFRNLPADLEGLKILQLSDIHLGQYVRLRHLELALDKAAPLHPDLVLVTGDVADNLRVLPDALRMIADLRPPLGSFACVGNHEYYRGMAQVRQSFDHSPIRLMINESETLAVGASRLHLGGIDDPRYMGRSTDEFYRAALAGVVAEGAEDTFQLMMIHRPDGFPLAAAGQVDLTLSGHTHGAQFGLDGRSLLEPFMPRRYLWGHYRRETSQLYTTAGMGHWFPFRLGCPPEAPLFTLERS